METIRVEGSRLLSSSWRGGSRVVVVVVVVVAAVGPCDVEWTAEVGRKCSGTLHGGGGLGCGLMFSVSLLLTPSHPRSTVHFTVLMMSICLLLVLTAVQMLI